MIIELLRFKINPNKREEFIQKDDEIWTTAISSYPGYLGKEVWINPIDKNEIVMIIKWKTTEQWKSISAEELVEISQKFDSSLGFKYEMVESSEYQVRKFPQPNMKSDY
ncbi:MAG: TIGR03792 family protein [Mastigocoleus sp.]